MALSFINRSISGSNVAAYAGSVPVVAVADWVDVGWDVPHAATVITAAATREAAMVFVRSMRSPGSCVVLRGWGVRVMPMFARWCPRDGSGFLSTP
jgi:hypothetical protein